MARKSTSRRKRRTKAELEHAKRAQLVKDITEAAMLALPPDVAAHKLGMTRDQFDELMQDPQYATAWAKGRLTLTVSLHADLVQASRDGKVAATMRLLELARDNPPLFGKAQDGDVAPPLKLTDGSPQAEFNRIMQQGGSA